MRRSATERRVLGAIETAHVAVPGYGRGTKCCRLMLSDRRPRQVAEFIQFHDSCHGLAGDRRWGRSTTAGVGSIGPPRLAAEVSGMRGLIDYWLDS